MPRRRRWLSDGRLAAARTYGTRPTDAHQLALSSYPYAVARTATFYESPLSITSITGFDACRIMHCSSSELVLANASLSFA